ncbi:unnamed protein product, partial [Polarella glacialis]
SVQELKQMLRDEGYDADQIRGVEKDELVDKLLILRANPAEEDEFPLPLYSNCMPQFILRAIFLAVILFFTFRMFMGHHWNVLLLLLVSAVLTVRNIQVRKEKAEKRRKRV